MNDIKQGANAVHKETKSYQSAMIQGWNKFCFTGGILEIKAKLPGYAHIGGLWPAMWLLGNLARGTYVGSSNNVWPWSYDKCDRTKQSRQRFSACNKVVHYDFHPLEGRGAPEIDLLEAMPGKQELKNTPVHLPYFSTSLQISPGSPDVTRPTVGEVPRFPPHPLDDSKSPSDSTDDKYRVTDDANVGDIPQSVDPPKMHSNLFAEYNNWYQEGLEYGDNSSLNIYFYGMHLAGTTADKDYSADAISANTNLTKEHFDEFSRYRLEWQPKLDAGDIPVKYLENGEVDRSPASGHPGYIAWYLDDQFLYRIDGSSLDLTGALMPEEPMYIIFNTAVSSTWGFPQPCPKDCAYCKGDKATDCFDCRKLECACSMPTDMCKNFPAYFLIDWVRVYQADTEADYPEYYENKDWGAGEEASSATADMGPEPLPPASAKNYWRHFTTVEQLGCSTPTHPTRTYILGNRKDYMTEGDWEPIHAVNRGGGSCTLPEEIDGDHESSSNSRRQRQLRIPGLTGDDDANDDGLSTGKISGQQSTKERFVHGNEFKGTEDGPCGGTDRGECVNSKCVCKGPFTGPTCLAHDGYDDIQYEDGKEWMILEWFVLPKPFLIGVVVLLGLLLYVVKTRVNQQGKQRGEFRMKNMGYESVVDTDSNPLDSEPSEGSTGGYVNEVR